MVTIVQLKQPICFTVLYTCSCSWICFCFSGWYCLYR